MKPGSHIQFAQEYFDYLSERFPVMCASDEFHFMPRASSAVKFFDRLDDIEADAMIQVINDLKAFKRRFEGASRLEEDLEKQIDLKLLGSNAAGVLIAFDRQRIWRHNPLLYLKIAFIGLDHARYKPSSGPTETIDRIIARLNVGGPAKHVVWLTDGLSGEYETVLIAGKVQGAVRRAVNGDPSNYRYDEEIRCSIIMDVNAFMEVIAAPSLSRSVV